MSTKNTALFGVSLLAAVAAITGDHLTSEASKAIAAAEESYSPCAAAMPPPKPGERNYDDLIDEYSTGVAPAPQPTRSAPVDAIYPCSIGAL